MKGRLCFTEKGNK